MRILALLLCVVLAHPAIADPDQDKSDANQALAESRWDDAARLFTNVVKANPDDGESRYRLAMALMSLDRLDEAAAEFKAADELGYQPLGVGYRLARIYARQGEDPAALEKLDEIAQAGFPALQLVENEADFDALRDEPGFVSALDKIRTNRYPCKGNHNNRGFDFWVAGWDVSYLGQPAGTSEIQLILGDCVVFENWQSASGTSGKSFNYYDASRDHWRQIWVDDTGGVIEFTGQIRDGVMYYKATTVDAATGAETRHKLTFSMNDDGSVRQFWETSSDAGASWQTSFDGHYVKKPGLASSTTVD